MANAQKKVWEPSSAPLSGGPAKVFFVQTFSFCAHKRKPVQMYHVLSIDHSSDPPPLVNLIETRLAVWPSTTRNYFPPYATIASTLSSGSNGIQCY